MARSLSNTLLNQLFAQESNDPFLCLLTLSHADFASDIFLVNNSVDVISRGETYSAFPMRVILPADDGERAPQVTLELDNVSLELIDELRNITDPIGATLELILASDPDTVEISYEELKLKSITYDSKKIQAVLYIDDIFYTEIPHETYSPSNFPGVF